MKNSNLIQRIITGIVLILVAIAVIFYLPQAVFFWLSGVIVLWCAWEWSSFLGVKYLWQRLVFVVLTFVAMYFIYQLPALMLISVAFAWWLLALLMVLTYPTSAKLWSASKVLRALVGLLTLVPAWLAVNVIFLSNNGSQLLFFLLVLIWGADIGAYFMGRYWGKRKLLSKVSPKKTWEGCGGGALLALVLGFVMNEVMHLGFDSYGLLIVLVLLVVVFSIVGDLLESSLKRIAGVKDSGNILPGHGGILDRLDSLFAAAPVFLFACLIMHYLA